MSKMPQDAQGMLNKIKQSLQSGEKINEKSLREFVTNLDTRDLLKVGLKQIRSYLPNHEKHYPHVTWIREWLEQAEKLEAFTRPNGFDPYPEGVTDTKLSAFIDGIGNLDHALTFYLRNDDTTSKNLVFSAISAVASAKLITFCIEDDPESWEIYQQVTEETEEKIFDHVRKYRNDSRFKEYEKSVWQSLLNDMSKFHIPTNAKSKNLIVVAI